MKQARNNLYQTLTDAVMGISDWKISGRQADFLNSYEAQEKQQDELELRMEKFNRQRNFLFQIIVAFVTVAMIWFASASVEVRIVWTYMDCCFRSCRLSNYRSICPYSRGHQPSTSL